MVIISYQKTESAALRVVELEKVGRVVLDRSEIFVFFLIFWTMPLDYSKHEFATPSFFVIYGLVVYIIRLDRECETIHG